LNLPLADIVEDDPFRDIHIVEEPAADLGDNPMRWDRLIPKSQLELKYWCGQMPPKRPVLKM
jgi:hypothetical protein